MQINSIRLSSALVLAAAIMLLSPVHAEDAKPSVMIVKDALVEKDGNYSIEGVAYNPNAKAVKNVVITYRVWKKWLGQEGHGNAVKEKGGLLSATVKAIPPKQSTEFKATGGNNAPVIEGQTPEKLEAEISAEWSK
jgi:hypothetical protein